MNCREARQKILQFVFDEDLPVEELEEMKEHLEDCEECEEERKLIGDLLNRLQEWPEQELPAEAKSDILAEIHNRGTAG